MSRTLKVETTTGGGVASSSRGGGSSGGSDRRWFKALKPSGGWAPSNILSRIRAPYRSGTFSAPSPGSSDTAESGGGGGGRGRWSFGGAGEGGPVAGCLVRMGRMKMAAKKGCKIPPHRRAACSTGFTQCFLAIINLGFLAYRLVILRSYDNKTVIWEYLVTVRLVNDQVPELCGAPGMVHSLQICGIVLVGLGLWLRIDRDSSAYSDLVHRIPTTGPLIVGDRLSSAFILVGICVVGLSFLGCCGACADSACFLCLYMLLLVVILIAEIVVGISVSAYSTQISQSLQTSLQYQIRYEYNKTGSRYNASAMTSRDSDHVTMTWNIMQLKLNCCGAVGPEDYRDSVWFNRTGRVDDAYVPSSCCTLGVEGRGSRRGVGSGDTLLKEEDECQMQATMYESSRKTPYPKVQDKTSLLKVQGCQKSIMDWIHSNTSTIVFLILLAVSIQIVDFTFACVLMKRLRERHSNCHWSDDFG